MYDVKAQTTTKEVVVTKEVTSRPITLTLHTRRDAEAVAILLSAAFDSGLDGYAGDSSALGRAIELTRDLGRAIEGHLPRATQLSDEVLDFIS